MEFLVQNGRELFIMVLFPVLGLLLEVALPAKTIRIILIAVIVCLIPIFTEYTYILPHAYALLILFALACIYSFFSRRISNQTPKLVAVLLCTLLLLAIAGFAYFINAMGTAQTTEKKWTSNGYQVEYIVDQGFSGKPLRKFELSKLSPFPVFKKKIETVIEDDSAKNCTVRFERSGILFNKCDGVVNNSR